mmetsp:Transcript_28855/g.42740  ORF Transcript_28855/g.42740 Transcript_28855/m.42740 type:complete len:369 (+) Transcript_28855:192-1298(+)|eukprot:CAMPEP_0195519062 /NCGR_PEP_ID=MMETSP0794_2-20130614/14296_1 /TAXON_ID=515487 /ORGANISM="Stephanopyxis turris, Strain CCMP 815" /LENGTH=368 /DNA_ID=CAMNT_0040648155 /DNA_START=188 /DNA_END=1294 /DNA_ORIENTATION=+
MKADNNNKTSTSSIKTKRESSNSKLFSSSSSSLPLEWTSVKRRRITKNQDGSTKNSQEEGESCVDGCDPSCLFNDDAMARKFPNNSNESKKNITLQGLGIFCLHDTSTSWFQGYFVPKHGTTAQNRRQQEPILLGKTSKPLGILAIERDTDECVQCADGGYRELDITITSFMSKNNNNNTAKNGSNDNKRRATFTAVCTGGDMMRMRSCNNREFCDGSSSSIDGSSVTASDGGGDVAFKFDADKVLTGWKAIKYLDAYFKPLIQKQRNALVLEFKNQQQSQGKGEEQQQAGSSTSSSVAQQELEKIYAMGTLELLPDCAIVLGDMVLSGPKTFLSSARIATKKQSDEKVEGNKTDKAANDDSDGWLSA